MTERLKEQRHAITLRVLDRARQEAQRFLDSLESRPVRAAASLGELREALGGDLPEKGTDPVAEIASIAEAMDRGIVASAGPRYFGFVIGGSTPATIAADWLTSVWDQNPGLYATSPAMSVAEETAARWVLELLGLPATAGLGFVTGCQMANFTCLAAARHAVLRRIGWDVEENGLQGAPKVNIVISEEAHVTIHTSLRMLGFGLEGAKVVPTDDEGRMRADDLQSVLGRLEGPTIVCAQAGNVNSGSFDPISEIVEIAHARGAWVHIDGAFGLWASVVSSRAHLLRGFERADSWATDAHKWLNVPYDCGIAIVADRNAQRGAMSVKAAYLEHAENAERDPFEWGPEFSRRGRGFTVYTALRTLGRQGVVAMIERNCDQASRIAKRLGEEKGIEILNDVVLNQVLVRFEGENDEAGDQLTREVIRRVQQEGTCWLGGTVWHGKGAMRISVSNWSTTDEDIDRSADAILRAWREGR
ncbi:MAG: aminotransferase class V-fold PLP-dependent enzyme [Thermoanaerobaculia bacterium]